MHTLPFFFVLFFPDQLFADSSFLSSHISSHERVSQLLEKKGYGTHNISICYNYSCRTKNTVYISKQDVLWIENIFLQLFNLNNNSKNERRAIAETIAFFETIAAKQTPVYNDKGKNYNDDLLPGRMDCIDETVNTVHYLQFIADLKALKWHQVEPPVYRSSWFIGQHWAAQIKDVSSGKYYAVDSWENDNGMLPIIQEVKYWKNSDDIEPK